MGNNDAPLISQLPLESIISTTELRLRPARPPDFEALNGALLALGRTMADSPERILQQLVESALDLCHAHSAGISLLEEEHGRKIFRWHGVAGEYSPRLWGTTPREFSPCGTVLDTDSVQLMSQLDRHFNYFAEVEPRISEALLVPFHVRGHAVGTVWVISHNETRKFDAEDARTITLLGDFAAAAYQALSGSMTLKSVLATIRDPLLVLDGTLAVRMASQSFYENFGLTPGTTEGNLLYEIGGGAWDIPELRTLLGKILPREKAFESFEVTKDFPALGRRTMSLSVRKLALVENPLGLILLTIEDITKPKGFQQEPIPASADPRTAPVHANGRVDDGEEPTQNFDEFIGGSAPIKRVMRQVEMVAPTDATVLILGETGTGKELIARALHRLSPRTNRPFVSLNCAAIPTGLLESELFGYEKGAFTGALSQKFGRFELANGGTLFLDEVGDIPMELQPKLLRALQEKSFERLGGTKTITINVRLVAATNRNLAGMMKANVFRSDLYYRLMVFPIASPPLREQPDAIPALVSHFTEMHASRLGRKIDTIPPETMDALVNWPWPGNVRELENFIERAVILSRGTALEAPIHELHADSPEPKVVVSLETVERDHILGVFRKAAGVISVAANMLGLPRSTLDAKLKRLNISRRDV